MDKLDMESKNIVSSNIEKIKELFPNVITEDNGKEVINFEALKQELSEVIIDEKKEKYQLTWPGKKQAIVNANSPISKTLRPLKEKSINYDSANNIYIEGDNLEVLKILQESYLNKIKCIYIDPPYNTGNDFVYSDDFEKNKKEELIDSGMIDDNNNRLITNVSSSGRFHSDWLTMMYSRLKLARNLLTENGIIFISIDDNEQANLKKICDEIFGENNFVNCIALEITPSSGVKRAHKDKMYIKNKEYLLVYKKNSNIQLNPLYNEWEKFDKHYSIYFDGKEYTSLSAKINHLDTTFSNVSMDKYMYFDKIKSYILDNSENIYRTHDASKWAVQNVSEKDLIYNNEREIYKVYNDNGDYELLIKVSGGNYNRLEPLSWNLIDGKIQTLRGDLWLDFDKDMGNVSFEGGVPYPNGKKPVRLLKDIIRSVTDDEDIILDFFSGSGTTAHAVIELNKEEKSNRKFILIQIPEIIDYSKSDNKKLYSKYNFETICDLGEQRIKNILSNEDGVRIYKLDSSNMKDVFYKPNEVEQTNLFDYMINVKEDRTPEDLLTQVILDLGLTLDLPIEEKTLENNKVYYVAENALVACFDDVIDINIIDIICECQPLKVVFKDSSFRTDKDKINLEERVKKASPETKISIL